MQAADLPQALVDRKLIERAKGLVMKYAGLDEEAAYHRLQQMAGAQNRKLLEVAQTILFAGEVFRELEQPQMEQPPHCDKPYGRAHLWQRWP